MKSDLIESGVETLREGLNSLVDAFEETDSAFGDYTDDDRASFTRRIADGSALLDSLKTPDEWLAVVTDEYGDRIDSQTFSGDYSIDHIRDQAYAYFETMGTATSGCNIRFHPIGPERVDLAIGCS